MKTLTDELAANAAITKEVAQSLEGLEEAKAAVRQLSDDLRENQSRLWARVSQAACAFLAAREASGEECARYKENRFRCT